MSEIFLRDRIFLEERKQYYIKKIKCYNYDIKEHYTWDCYKLKKSQNLAATRWELRGVKQQVLTTITEWSLDLATLEYRSTGVNNQHMSMSLTVCYNDFCRTHQSDKNKSE